MRAIFDADCNSNANGANIRGIIYYDASSSLNPTSTGLDSTDAASGDEPYNSLVPYVAINPARPANASAISTLEIVGKFTTVSRWTPDFSSFKIDWS